MSGSKNAFGGGRGAWTRVTRSRRCPICKGDSWCSVRSDGNLVVCMRNSGGIERTDANGVTYYVHVLDGATPRGEVGPDVGGAPIADVVTLDEAHRMVLAQLRLTDEHAASLERRGLSRTEIRTRGYRTLPLEGRSALARTVVEHLGESAARSIPGVFVGGDGDRTWWSFAGSPGLVIPVRNTDGLIVALKIRRDSDDDGPRYTYVSSGSKGGPRAMLAVHVPLFGESVDWTEARVTEGELKADAASVLSSIPTISIPGVGSWRAALPVLDTLGVKRVRVAFDADHRTKPEVGIALALLIRGCVDARLGVTVETWDSSTAKGIDDALVRRATVRVTEDATTYASLIAERAVDTRGARVAA
jgi:hypothetical protein